MKKAFVGNLEFWRDRRVNPFTLRTAWNRRKRQPGDGRETGRSRGFAFVEMAQGDADKAIAALNGTKIGGRALNVNEARPEADRAGGGFREGYGGAPGQRREHRW